MKVFAPGPTLGHMLSAICMFDKITKRIIVMLLYIGLQANQPKLNGY